jgi:hypothetical protein
VQSSSGPNGVLRHRVEEVNAHPDLLHWVTEVRVFGSYLTNSDDLGEIDLAIKKEGRPASGSFSDAYPERLVARLLKGGSRYISLHGVAELDENFEFAARRFIRSHRQSEHDVGYPHVTVRATPNLSS